MLPAVIEANKARDGMPLPAKLTGISEYRGTRWEAHVWARGNTPEGGKRGRQIHLGYFASGKQAAEAYDRAVIFMRGAMDAVTNYPLWTYRNDPVLKRLTELPREYFILTLRDMSGASQDTAQKLIENKAEREAKEKAREENYAAREEAARKREEEKMMEERKQKREKQELEQQELALHLIEREQRKADGATSGLKKKKGKKSGAYWRALAKLRAGGGKPKGSTGSGLEGLLNVNALARLKQGNKQDMLAQLQAVLDVVKGELGSAVTDVIAAAGDVQAGAAEAPQGAPSASNARASLGGQGERTATVLPGPQLWAPQPPWAATAVPGPQLWAPQPPWGVAVQPGIALRPAQPLRGVVDLTSPSEFPCAPEIQTKQLEQLEQPRKRRAGKRGRPKKIRKDSTFLEACPPDALTEKEQIETAMVAPPVLAGGVGVLPSPPGLLGPGGLAGMNAGLPQTPPSTLAAMHNNAATLRAMAAQQADPVSAQFYQHRALPRAGDQ